MCVSTSAPRSGTGPRWRAAAEDAAEEVGEVEVRELRPAALCAGTAVRRAERVVGLALLGVGEHVIGALDLLEARLVATARVGMVLAGASLR